MNEIFVDISGRYATIDRHDRSHEAAQQFLENDYLRLVTTDYVTDETVTLPQVRLGHSCAVRFLDSLQASRLVQLIYLSQTQDATAQLFRNRPDTRLELYRLLFFRADAGIPLKKCTGV